MFMWARVLIYTSQGSSSDPLRRGHPSNDPEMCVSRCLRCVGVALVALATVCAVANVLLLLPELKVHFLLEGHVTREATWATGLWSSGLLVVLGARAFLQSSHTAGCCAFRTQMLRQALYSCACLLSSAFCCLVSFTGLVQGPHCLYNTTNGPAWGVPLQPTPDRDAGYLYNKSLWSGVCLEPKSVVQWNVVLFSILGGASGLQALLCAANFINTLLGVVLGRGVGNNKVGPVSV
ncbi:transmembrane 4 L6 family member 5 isoform X2 [Syngnathus scovelli]|uniref:transmembrane 4 L6 family member 5 isoform X2 n=1 Tax=Syngnathus scovelli TaxID=161590 RepID=UPI00210FE3F5|nr:transmembrane 4 L6 family member 5 isoform X3 [Syngnathus scovelli]